MHTIDRAVGGLDRGWAKKTGLKAGIPVVVGAFDCHLGAVGAGVTPGTLVKIIGTSTCDISVRENTAKLADVPGVCGIVDGSVLPGYFGIEAGQSAVGDIFNWWVNYIQPHGEKLTHRKLDEEALKLQARRKRLARAGLEQWQSHHFRGSAAHRPAGWPDALHDAGGSVSRADRGDGFRRADHHQPVRRIRRENFAVVNCGGIAEKSAITMQIYADVTGRPMKISRSAQTCALGSAIAAAVIAGAHKDYATAQKKMTGLKPKIYKPNPKAHAIYRELYPLYRTCTTPSARRNGAAICMA